MHYAEYYSEILKGRPKTLRSIARNATLYQLSLFNPLRASELKKQRVQFLYVHHLFKDEERKFEKLIRNLLRYHEIISYSEAVDKVLHNRIDKAYIVISSDDGFKNNLKLAEILDAYGIKACFFVNPAVSGISDYRAISRHCKEKLHLPPIEFMSWDDLEDLLNTGHEVGSHTMQHDNIARLTPAEIREDMNRSYEMLTSRLGSVKHFAFPYGRFSHFNDAARRACFEAGFVSCASAERGCHVNGFTLDRDQLCIRRDHIIADWNYRHIEYFLIAAAVKASPANNLFPYTAQDAHTIAH